MCNPKPSITQSDAKPALSTQLANLRDELALLLDLLWHGTLLVVPAPRTCGAFQVLSPGSRVRAYDLHCTHLRCRASWFMIRAVGGDERFGLPVPTLHHASWPVLHKTGGARAKHAHASHAARSGQGILLSDQRGCSCSHHSRHDPPATLTTLCWHGKPAWNTKPRFLTTRP